MENRPRGFFSEPSAWKSALGPIAASLLAFGLYLSRLLRYPESTGLPIFGIAFGIVAIAELLPNDRRRTATGMRVTAIGILLVQLVATYR